MAGPDVRLLLLLLLLARQTMSQETTTAGTETTTAGTENTTAPPPASGDRNPWTTLEDGSIELDSFTGDAVPPLPELQEARHLRIVNSAVQTIAEDTFRFDENITDATLEILNTTIHQWNSNTLDSFSRVNVTDSTIHQLNRSGIRFTRQSENRCDVHQEFDIVVLFSNTTIEEVHRDGLDLEPGRAQVLLTGCTILQLHDLALRLGLGAQLTVENSMIGELTPQSLSAVCSLDVRFLGNRLRHVAQHALHFGRPQCEPLQSDVQCRQKSVRRRVVTADNRLPCGPLAWLKHALHSTGLTGNTFRDYHSFLNSSSCSDRRDESVQSFLWRPPEPEPQPAAVWWHSVTNLAGIAVALSLGFLAIGLLVRGLCMAPCAASRFDFRSGGTTSGGDADISLPLQQNGRSCTADGADAGPRQRETEERYGTGPVRQPCPAPQRRPPAPLPEPARRPLPGHQRPAQQAGRDQPHDPRMEAGGFDQIYINPSAQDSHDQIYLNPLSQSGHDQIYQNQQQIYENQPPNPQHAEAPAYANQQWRQAPADPNQHWHQDPAYANQQWHQDPADADQQWHQDPADANPQWQQIPTDADSPTYQNLHHPKLGVTYTNS